jgi:hypothetical protein
MLKVTLTLEKAEAGLIGDTNYHEPLSITNSFGVPSQGPDFWQVRFEKSFGKCTQRANSGWCIPRYKKFEW